MYISNLDICRSLNREYYPIHDIFDRDHIYLCLLEFIYNSAMCTPFHLLITKLLISTMWAPLGR